MKRNPELFEYTKSLPGSASQLDTIESNQPSQRIHDHEYNLIEGRFWGMAMTLGFIFSQPRNEWLVGEEPAGEDQYGDWDEDIRGKERQGRSSGDHRAGLGYSSSTVLFASSQGQFAQYWDLFVNCHSSLLGVVSQAFRLSSRARRFDFGDTRRGLALNVNRGRDEPQNNTSTLRRTMESPRLIETQKMFDVIVDSVCLGLRTFPVLYCGGYNVEESLQSTL